MLPSFPKTHEAVSSSSYANLGKRVDIASSFSENPGAESFPVHKMSRTCSGGTIKENWLIPQELLVMKIFLLRLVPREQFNLIWHSHGIFFSLCIGMTIGNSKSNYCARISRCHLKFTKGDSRGIIENKEKGKWTHGISVKGTGLCA